MGTPYSECYEEFLGHIDDAELLFPIYDETDLEYEDRLNNYLSMVFKKALAKFSHSKTPLTKNDALEEFDNDLRPVEIEIIGLLMLVEYYRKKMNFISSVALEFSDKDWKTHSKANQLNAYRALIKDTKSEIKGLMIDNSFISNSGELGYVDDDE